MEENISEPSDRYTIAHQLMPAYRFVVRFALVSMIIDKLLSLFILYMSCPFAQMGKIFLPIRINGREIKLLVKNKIVNNNCKL